MARSSQRTVTRRTNTELLREYNALFSDRAVQRVMRYLVVKDELIKRLGKALPKAAAEQHRTDKLQGHS